jgi:hypothetical protein
MSVMVATSRFTAEYGGEQVTIELGERVDAGHELVRRFPDRFKRERGAAGPRSHSRQRGRWRL